MKKEMIKFHLNLLVVNIVIYAIFAAMALTDGIYENLKPTFLYMVLFFFLLSLTITVIVPLYKLFKDE